MIRFNKKQFQCAGWLTQNARLVPGHDPAADARSSIGYNGYVIFKVLADIIVIIHFLWIVFLLLGAIPGVRYRLIKILHISGLVYTVIIQIFGWYCPLTHVEVWLRMQHNPLLTYKGSFIAHYLEQIVYLEVPGSFLFIITVILVLLNIRIYKRGKSNKRKKL